MDEKNLLVENFREELGQVVGVEELIQRVSLGKGFEFTAIRHPANVYDAIIIRNPSHSPKYKANGVYSKHTLDEYVDFINHYGIEKAEIIADDISFLRKCPTLKHLNIIPVTDETGSFDFSPLYELDEVRSIFCRTDQVRSGRKKVKVDYSRIPGLEYLSISSPVDTEYSGIPTLKTLCISGSPATDVRDFCTSPELDTLEVRFSRINSLDGIWYAPRMQCLYLERNRSLSDINALSQVSSTLRALRIQNCPKITDFSVLEQLENLEYLFLEGSNVLPSLDFIRKMPKLKTLIVDFRIEDGDLTPCLDLSYAYCGTIRKHYNVKDHQLPRKEYFRGNDNIDLWRWIW